VTRFAGSDQSIPRHRGWASSSNFNIDCHGEKWGGNSVKNFILTRVGYTRFCFIHNSELGHHLSEWPSWTR